MAWLQESEVSLWASAETHISLLKQIDLQSLDRAGFAVGELDQVLPYLPGLSLPPSDACCRSFRIARMSLDEIGVETALGNRLERG